MYPVVPAEYIQAVKGPIEQETAGMSQAEIEAFLKGVKLAGSVVNHLESLGTVQIVLGLLAVVEVIQLKAIKGATNG
jgi:hypothetical protein